MANLSINLLTAEVETSIKLDDPTQIILFVAIICMLCLIISVLSRLRGFSQELKYLNSEIGRTTGKEQQHYIRKKRKLWLSLIPFVKK